MKLVPVFAALAAIVLAVPASAEKVRPLKGDPPATTSIKDAGPGAKSPIVAVWRAKFRVGEGTLTVTDRRVDGSLVGGYAGTNANGPFNYQLGKDCRASVDQDGSNFKMSCPAQGDFVGWVTGNKLVTTFTPKQTGLKPGPVSFTQ